MNSSICTLFEGDYHHGVAALVNSLYFQEFKGSVYVGYRGKLPEWALAGKKNSSATWPEFITLELKAGITVNFLPLETSYHLTNYKPDFMLSLWNDIAKDADALFYFDPDIVVTGNWALYEQWIKCGVALCEDVNSPLAANHPRRVGWRDYFGEKGFTLSFKDPIYVNGGFVGVSKKDIRFVEIWKALQEEMANKIGGLNRSSLGGEVLPPDSFGPFAPFAKTDQDALNASIEAYDGEYSLLGQVGMGLIPGAAVMAHAIGTPKPWDWKPLVQISKGLGPRFVDRKYWNNVNLLIKTVPDGLIKYRKTCISIAALIGRFYSRK